MEILDPQESEIVALLAVQPVTDFPSAHMEVVRKLQAAGVVDRSGELWHLTKVGRILLGQPHH